MPHGTRLCGTRVCCNVLLEFKTLEYHVRTIPNSHSTHTVNNSIHTATIVDLSPTIARLSISFNFLFFQLLLASSFVSYSSSFLIGFQVWVSPISFFCQGHKGGKISQQLWKGSGKGREKGSESVRNRGKFISQVTWVS